MNKEYAIYQEKKRISDMGYQADNIDYNSWSEDEDIKEFSQREYKIPKKVVTAKTIKSENEKYNIKNKKETPKFTEYTEKQLDKIAKREMVLNEKIKRFDPLMQMKLKREQKLRPERLEKRELRVKMLEERANRLQKIEKKRYALQRKISSILNKKKEKQAEFKMMSNQPTQDYNILHTPNLFNTSDARHHSVQTGGRILQAQNLLLRTTKKTGPSKWF